ncbi:hypothetical protein [Agromyces sp. Marseille-Q5079]|uniref:hypothetical protein n=1 Tax=Agromyces sp. Marseille-Q5079 TaxID=3439059 RepID=UPI003D9C7D9B
MTSPARTWLDLASSGCTEEDLVVAADRLITRRHTLATVHDLERILLRHPGARGIRTLRAALEEAIETSDSSRETRLRVRIIRAGLPRPVAAFVVRDEQDRFVATTDLAFPDHRVLLEYEGGQHLIDRRQWAHDLARFNRFQQLGWICLRIGADQFADLDATIRLIAATPATARASAPPSAPPSA